MRQVTKFYVASFLKNQTYFTPILILFLQFQALSFKEIFWVFTIGSVVSFLIEIPTGVFADLYGKRNSIIISKAGIFLSYIVFGFSTNFYHFVFAQILYEIGNAFRSGTETAYTYDYLNQNKKGNPTYTEVKGKQKFWARVGESAATAIGGFLAIRYGYNWVFFIASVPAFVNFLVSLRWEKIEENSSNFSVSDSISHIRTSLKELKKNNLLKLMTNIVLFNSVVAAVEKFVQPYMVSAGIPVEWFGIIYAVSLGLAAFSVRYSYIFEQKLGNIRSINILSLIAAVSALIIGLTPASIFGVLLFFVVIVADNFRSPIVNSEFHDRISSKGRATLGSILELYVSFGKIMILPVAGYLADAFSLLVAVVMMSVFLVVNTVFLRIIR
ncbi:MFS transporter [Candidatus Woesearchaeota archaeon]|nr:MFS transporter [Candidatus Woesearchaeota archaeon]